MTSKWDGGVWWVSGFLKTLWGSPVILVTNLGNNYSIPLLGSIDLAIWRRKSPIC